MHYWRNKDGALLSHKTSLELRDERIARYGWQVVEEAERENQRIREIYQRNKANTVTIIQGADESKEEFDKRVKDTASGKSGPTPFLVVAEEERPLIYGGQAEGPVIGLEASSGVAPLSLFQSVNIGNAP